jgi:hypothetical protein
VLTKMLESCIEKKVIPFPWEKIIEAVSTKRRSSGNTNISRAGVIATMTAAEATTILVEAIDVNVRDESIRYGFQSFDQDFIEDSSLPHANTADAKISNTLQRRNSSIRQSVSRRDSRADSNDASTGEVTETESEVSLPTMGDAASDKTLKNVLLLLQSMATNIEQLQQDVNELRGRDQGCRGCKCGNGSSSPASIQRVASAPSESSSASSTCSPHAVQPHEASRTTNAKEDLIAQLSRKPSLVAIALAPSSLVSRGSSEKHALAKLQKARSSTQDHRGHDGSASSRVNAVVGAIRSPDGESFSARSPANLSGRARAARNQTLADMLWNRSNTSGDLLKHTEEERHASRIRRQIRTRHSMPTELVAEQASPRETEDQLRSSAGGEGPRQHVPGHSAPSVWDASAPKSLDTAVRPPKP